LRFEPQGRRDLMVSAVNNWLLAFDNVSSLPGWLSDGFCRLATGGAFAARKLYDDEEEHHLSACRPVLINGIASLASRSDLVDRSLFLNLPPIPDSRRQYEEDFWQAFRADYPQLLGGLLDAVAAGLRKLPEVQLEARPRMADFARWGEAIAQALGQPRGTFLSAYLENRQGACLNALDDSPVARAVLELMDAFGYFGGTATEFYTMLTRATADPIAAVKRWPKSPIWMSDHLRRAAPGLRAIGVIVTFNRDRNSRKITIERYQPAKHPDFPPSSSDVLVRSSNRRCAVSPKHRRL
jgi:hypothetical protein